jgi:outer membrane protein assembly factor BamA
LVKEQGHLLQSGNIPGSNGGAIAGIGPALMFDSRDNVINAGRGFFSKFTALSYQPFSENLEKYQLLNLDLRYFYSPSDKHTIALQHISTATFNEVPFFQLPMIGGEQMMRGYYRGAYRDNHLNAVQAEYRLTFWKNLGMVFFGSTAWISQKAFRSNINEALFSGGTGFRYQYDADKKINMRLDLAWGQNSFGVYFGIGEAF